MKYFDHPVAQVALSVAFIVSGVFFLTHPTVISKVFGVVFILNGVARGFLFARKLRKER